MMDLHILSAIRRSQRIQEINKSFNSESWKTLEFLLSKPDILSNIDKKNIGGDAPLHLAAEKDCEEICKILLKHNANVETKNSLGMTALHIASEKGHIKNVKLLLDYNSDVNAMDASGNTALHFTALSRDDLLAGNICKNFDIDTMVPLNRKHRRMPIVDFYQTHSLRRIFPCFGYSNFFKEPEDVDFNNDPKNRKQIAEMLLEKGAFVDVRNKFGASPLHAAVYKEKEELVQLLIDKYDADVNATTNDNTTPLHFSAFNTKMSITEMLLRKKVNIHATKGDAGTTALHYACRAGRNDIVQILLHHGADIEARTKYGRTPLHRASEYGHTDLVHLLLYYGADVDTKCENGKTALYMACESMCNSDVMRVLLYYGADVNMKMLIGNTPLYRVCNSQEFIELDHLNCILECGPDINITGHTALTPFESIEDKTVVDIIQLIEQHVIKMRATNRYVSGKNVQFLLSTSAAMTNETRNRAESFEKECIKEVEEMKKSRIIGKISFYDILTKDNNVIAIYSRNDAVLRAMNSREYMEIFPIYRNMIYYRFKIGQKRQRLLEPSADSLNRLIGYEFPLVARMEITSYLSNEELKSLIEACPIHGDTSCITETAEVE